MASTATNKQPLLVDSPLHKCVDLQEAMIPQGSVMVPNGNSCIKVLDCTNNDGALIEAAYSTARNVYLQSEDTDGTHRRLGYVVCMYLCANSQYCKADQAYLVASWVAGTNEAAVTTFSHAPRVLSPVARLGGVQAEGSQPVEPTYMRALYIPKGMCLWAGVEALKNPQTPDGTPAVDIGADAPLLGVQGGWY